MSSSDSLRSAVVDRVAAQWTALGVTLASPSDSTLIDLEALVAVTAELGELDARVLDGAMDWCVRYGQFINIGRLRTVAAEMKGDPDRLGSFAATVAGAGGPSWPLATQPRPGYRNRGKLQVGDLRGLPRLVWRLRAAFGVNARADVVAALAVPSAPELAIADLARLTRFTKRNIAVAVSSLHLAGVVDVERIGNEDRVRLAREPALLAWLSVAGAGPVVDWVARYAVALRIIEWAERTPLISSRVRAIEARALVASVAPAIRRAGLPEPETQVLGEPFGERFDAWLDEVGRVFRAVQPA